VFQENFQVRGCKSIGNDLKAHWSQRNFAETRTVALGWLGHHFRRRCLPRGQADPRGPVQGIAVGTAHLDDQVFIARRRNVSRRLCFIDACLPNLQQECGTHRQAQ
jgi:hypothetical protein